jgi:hypothetical protein
MPVAPCRDRAGARSIDIGNPGDRQRSPRASYLTMTLPFISAQWPGNEQKKT